MTMILKNIKEFVTDWKNDIAGRVARLDGAAPQLAIIQVGENQASNRYVRNKIKDCKEVGITAHNYWYADDIPEEELLREIEDIQSYYSGVIVQLPLPKHIDPAKVTAVIDPRKDVDGFRKDSKFVPCTPGGIIKYLEYCDFKFLGSHCVVIGRSEIVGKPMAQLLLDKNSTVTVCHSKSQNIDRWVRNADLVVCAVGKARFLNCYSLHMPIIDVGINFDENGRLVGDCYNTANRDVTPVPGGVGLLTRCMLLENVLEAANDNNK